MQCFQNLKLLRLARLAHDSVSEWNQKERGLTDCRHASVLSRCMDTPVGNAVTRRVNYISIGEDCCLSLALLRCLLYR